MTTRYSHFLFADAITHEIIAPIEAGGTVRHAREEYDINTIASRVLEYDGHGFVLKVDTEKFWDIVQEHAWANILARTLQDNPGMSLYITEKIEDFYDDDVFTHETITLTLRYETPEDTGYSVYSLDRVSDLMDEFPDQVTRTITPGDDFNQAAIDAGETPLAAEYEAACDDAMKELLGRCGLTPDKVTIADGAECYRTENGYTTQLL